MNEPPRFRPLPLLGNPHVQTILANVLGGSAPRLPADILRVDLPDGDALAVHDSMPSAWHPGRPVVVLIHGLGGNHSGPYLRRLAAFLTRRGFRVGRVDLRGAGAGTAWAKRLYNANGWDDVAAVLLRYRREAPTSPLGVLGFSLGGNIALRLAAELAGGPLEPAATAAVNPPLDLLRCSAMLQRQPLYDRHYVRNLTRQVRDLHSRLCPDAPPIRFPRGMTLREFDDRYTAPRGGFDSAEDYYRRASTLPHLERIRTSTLILTARDDPFVAVESFESVRVGAHVEVEIVPQGGHLGFLGWDGAGGIRWMERRVAAWILQRLEP